MKLPEYNPRGVQKFATPPAGALAAQGRAKMGEAQAQGDMFSGIATGVAEQADLMLRRQVQDKENSTKMERLNWLNNHIGKEYFSADEIPDDVEIPAGRTVTIVDEDGNKVEEPRRIPRAEVLPQLYQRHMSAVIDAASSDIQGRREADEFKQAEMLALEGDMLKLNESAYEDMRQSRRDEQDNQRALLREAGDYEGLKELSRNFEGTDLEREQRLREDNINEELDYLSSVKALDAQTPEDVELIEKTAADLRDLEGTEMEMPDKARLQAANEMDAVAAQSRHNMNAAELREEGTRIANIEIAIDKDHTKVTAGEIDAEYSRGFMSPEKRSQLHRKLIDHQKRGVGEALDMERAMFYMSNDVYISPQDKGVQKALDKYTVNAVKAGENPNDVYTRVASKTGYIPEAAQWEITAANNAYTEQMASGLALYNQIVKASPNATWSIPETQVDRIKTVNARMVGGKMDFATAIKMQQDWDNKSPAEQKHIQNMTSSKDFAKNNGSALSKFVGNTDNMVPQGWTQARPDFPEVMLRDFDVSVEHYLPSMGYNLELAQARAFEDIKTTWGLSETKHLGAEAGMTSDYTYMKYPPQLTPEQVKADIEDVYGKGDYIIQSDFVTDRNARNGDPLTYQVYKVNPDTGTPEEEAQRWTPATAKQAEKREAERKIAGARDIDIKALEAKKLRIRDQATRGLLSHKNAAPMIEEVQAQIDAAKAFRQNEGR